MDQRTDEWFKAKAGKVSSSRIDAVMSGLKTSGYNTMLYRIAAEQMTGEYIQNGFQSKAMADGIESEPDGVAEYEFVTGSNVEPVGFILSDANPRIGCSPDGLVGDICGLELKSPLASTQIKYLQKKVVPSEYVKQIQFQMYVTGRKEWDFFSYHPKLKPLLIKCEPDQNMFDKFTERLEFFFEQVDKIIEEIS